MGKERERWREGEREEKRTRERERTGGWKRCGEEEDGEDWPVACNLRPLKTRWETAWLLCLNGTGDGVCGAGKNVEGSNGGWTRNVHVPPGEREVLAL